MAIPVVQEPLYLFERPFANEGTKNIIPATNNEATGLASQANGFPAVTQLPVKTGGIPPERADFNGILYMLSSFAYWQQSGGLMTYKTTLQYSPLCMVCYSNDIFICKKANGVDTSAGTKTPGIDTDYWTTLFQYILEAGQASGTTSSLGVPIGTVIMYSGANLPDEGKWLECNGQSCAQYPKLVAVLGKNTVPNLSGKFAQCKTAFLAVGTEVEAGLPNITGRFVQANYENDYTQGAFYQTGQTGGPCAHKSDSRYLGFFDASRSSAVYGKSETVQPPAYVLNFLIKAE